VVSTAKTSLTRKSGPYLDLISTFAVAVISKDLIKNNGTILLNHYAREEQEPDICQELQASATVSSRE